MPIIGLTGNFGMGKSTVLRLFNNLGALTYDVDGFVHSILEDPEIIKRITRVLGKEALIKDRTGASINKRYVANIIFSDTQKRRAVEEIIHPEVLKAIKRTASSIFVNDPSAIIIFEVPLLFEAGYKEFFDKVIVVFCNRDTALERLARKGFSREEALKRIRAQMPITKKKRLADFVIDNNGEIEKTESQARKIYNRLIDCYVKMD